MLDLVLPGRGDNGPDALPSCGQAERDLRTIEGGSLFCKMVGSVISRKANVARDPLEGDGGDAVSVKGLEIVPGRIANYVTLGDGS